MDDAESRAYRSYQETYVKFPKSVRILKSYAAFLDDVMNKPLMARKLLLDAEKIERSGEDDAGGAGDGEGGESAVDDKRDGIIVISTTGIITVANERLARMFGRVPSEASRHSLRPA